MKTHPSHTRLALEGGPKVLEAFEGRGEPKIGHEEFLEMADTWGYSPATIARIREVIQSENLGAGPFLNRYYNPRPSKVTRLEQEVAALLGAKHVFAVSSCTGALHSAMVAADIGCGDEVIVPSYTFIATAFAVVAARGMPVWCEVDQSMTMDPADLERKISPRTRAVAPVHMNGYVCNMDAILAIARKYNLRVIEDCAQAFGASYRGRRVGTWGDLGCFSISSYKVTGGGEGGLIVSSHDALFARAQGWAEAGGLWRPDRFAHPRWKGELFCGLNYRMSELEATVDLVQIRKADAQLERWRANKRRILEMLPRYRELQPQKIHDLNGEMGHSIGCFLPTAIEAERFRSALQAEGVRCSARGANPPPDWHYSHDMEQINQHMPATSDGCPWQCPKVRERGGPVNYSQDPCPRSRDLFGRHLIIPVDQWWTPNDCETVAAAIIKVADAFYPRGGDGVRGWL